MRRGETLSARGDRHRPRPVADMVLPHDATPCAYEKLPDAARCPVGQRTLNRLPKPDGVKPTGGRLGPDFGLSVLDGCPSSVAPKRRRCRVRRRRGVSSFSLPELRYSDSAVGLSSCCARRGGRSVQRDARGRGCSRGTQGQSRSGRDVAPPPAALRAPVLELRSCAAGVSRPAERASPSARCHAGIAAGRSSPSCEPPCLRPAVAACLGEVGVSNVPAADDGAWH